MVNPEKKTYPDPDNPGPMDYKKEKPFGSTAVGFSISYKIDFDHDTTLALKRGHPAPGQYADVAAFHKTGSYPVSFYRGSGAAKFGKTVKIPPDVMEAAKFPGPGYHEHTGNVADGFQAVSTFRSAASSKFGNEGRPEWASRFQTPGPAAYISPSDFGYVTLSPRLGGPAIDHTKTRRIYGAKPTTYQFPVKHDRVVRKMSTNGSKILSTSPTG